MPEYNDCTFDKFTEDYAEIILDRMDSKDLEQYVYDSLIDYYQNMTEKEFIEHVNEMEDEETADELIGLYYGKNPPDCYITDRWKSNSQRIRSAWFSIVLRGMFKAMTITIYVTRLTRSSRS